MGRISAEQMKYTSRLAALKLSEDELATVREGIEELLDCFDVLENLDITGVSPAVYTCSGYNVFREDVAEMKSDHESMLQNAPSVRDGAFVVMGMRKSGES